MPEASLWRCLMSLVSRALAQSFLAARPSSFAVTIPIDRCRVRITPIATILLRRKQMTPGQKSCHRPTQSITRRLAIWRNAVGRHHGHAILGLLAFGQITIRG